MLRVLVVFNWGKKEKKICVAKKKKNAVTETSQGVVWGGKRVAESLLHVPSSQATAKLRPRFLPFSSPAEPGPRL